MSDKKTANNNNNHKADTQNPNSGTTGNNPANGNRGKQLNPNQKP